MFLVYALALVSADQLTKLWAVRTLPLGGEGLPLALGFDLTYIRNTGAAFGMLRNLSVPLGFVTLDGTLLLGLLSLAVAVLLTVYMYRNLGRLSALTMVALTLILAGAAGNGIDRLRLGYVVDFIHFQVGSFDFAVFNIADSCVVIGAGLLLLGGLFGGRQPTEVATSEVRHGDASDEAMSEPDFFQNLD
jgi:signal peptidase II